MRERIEDRAREDLAESLDTRTRGEAMLRAASHELAQAREKRRSAGSGMPVSGQDLAAAHAYLEQAQRAHEARQLDLDRCDAEVDARRAALLSAARERQVLERLKERRRSDHTLAVRRAEGAVLDELALGVHRRKEARS